MCVELVSETLNTGFSFLILFKTKGKPTAWNRKQFQHKVARRFFYSAKWKQSLEEETQSSHVIVFFLSSGGFIHNRTPVSVTEIKRHLCANSGKKSLSCVFFFPKWKVLWLPLPPAGSVDQDAIVAPNACSSSMFMFSGLAHFPFLLPVASSQPGILTTLPESIRAFTPFPKHSNA